MSLHSSARAAAPRRERPSMASRVALLMALGLVLAATPALASREASGPDRSGSPYFVVKGAAEGDTEALPLESTRADVHVAGTIAHVKVTQVYKNAGKSPIEAVYVFPGSTRAAVFGMRMKVGERTVVAKIQKREEARKTYEDAKAQGKTASLLEQQRPNVFQMNVANILPGDRVEVQLDYTELLVPDEGVYELVYPAVVGPRYVGERTDEQAKQDGWTATPHTRKGEAPSYDWDLNVRLAAGVPIRSVVSPSHALKVTGLGQPEATVALNDPRPGGDRDFVLQFKLAGEAISSGLVLYPGEDESFFLMMVQPPARVAPKDRPRREYVFILDVSGSMHGFPLDTAKALMRRLIAGMDREDAFNIMFFSGGAKVLAERSLPVTDANRDAALAMMESMRGGGGTELVPALRRALAMPADPEVSRTFVVVTDGYVSVENDAFELVRDNLGKANLFAFGIGSSVNRHLIEGLARAGQGEPYVVLGGDDAPVVADKFQKVIESPALTRIKVAFEGFDAYDVEPAQVPDLFAQRPVVVFGKYRGQPKGRISVRGVTGAGGFGTFVEVAKTAPSKDNSALRYLWARHRIAALSDMNRLIKSDERVQAVTQLGLAYNLMTQYTSFVAVDERVRNDGGQQKTVQQPLPLPAGVEETAVGGGPGGIGFSGTGMGGGGAGMGGLGGGPRVHGLRSAPSGRPSAKPVKEAEAPSSQAKLQSIAVKGALDQEVVNRVLRTRLNAFRACYEQSVLRGDPTAQGKVTVKLVIGADGKVTQVTLPSIAKGLGPMSDCLQRMMRRVVFPAPKGGGVVLVQFDLVLVNR